MRKNEFCYAQLNLNAKLELIDGTIRIPEITLFAEIIAIRMDSRGIEKNLTDGFNFFIENTLKRIWCSIPAGVRIAKGKFA